MKGLLSGHPEEAGGQVLDDVACVSEGTAVSQMSRAGGQAWWRGLQWAGVGREVQCCRWGHQVPSVGSLVVKACDPHPHAWDTVTRVRPTGADSLCALGCVEQRGRPGVPPPQGRQLADSAGVQPSVCAGPEGHSSSGTGQLR